jgi:hypothetical protein
LQTADAGDRARPATILQIMLILSKKKFAAKTAPRVECRPELCSGEMEKRRFIKPAYKRQRLLNVGPNCVRARWKSAGL